MINACKPHGSSPVGQIKGYKNCILWRLRAIFDEFFGRFSCNFRNSSRPGRADEDRIRFSALCHRYRPHARHWRAQTTAAISVHGEISACSLQHADWDRCEHQTHRFSEQRRKEGAALHGCSVGGGDVDHASVSTLTTMREGGFTLSSGWSEY